jgi:hypothetical protein
MQDGAGRVDTNAATIDCFVVWIQGSNLAERIKMQEPFKTLLSWSPLQADPQLWTASRTEQVLHPCIITIQIIVIVITRFQSGD